MDICKEDNLATMKSVMPLTRKHDLSVFPNGRIDISAHAAKLLELRPGDVIDIMTDGLEWVLCVRLRSEDIVGRHRARVYHTSRRPRGTFRTWCRPLAGEVLRRIGRRGVLRCPCGDQVNLEGGVRGLTLIINFSLTHEQGN